MLTPAEKQAVLDAIDAGTFDLDDALNNIAIKQRGEDVRKSIYGGILLVNKEGKAGAVDVKARQRMTLLETDVNKQIAAIEKEMGNFVANNSGTTRSTLMEETTLMNSTVAFEASNTSSLPTGATAAESISLSDVMTNYDYIEIEYAGAGRAQIVRFRPDQIRQTVRFSVIKFEDANSYSTTTREVDDGQGQSHQETVIGDPHCELVIVNFRLSYTVADSLYAEANMWRWSGVKGADGFIKSAITAGDGVRIFRVRGIKYTQVDTTTKDAELTNLRVGYDNTEYSSAGEAVRSQIAALQAQINALNTQAVMVDSNGYIRFDGGE